jgi:hypothetical protein
VPSASPVGAAVIETEFPTVVDKNEDVTETDREGDEEDEKEDGNTVTVKVPTAAPSAASDPISLTTKAPSSKPSISPSGRPSFSPSGKPSISPTISPAPTTKCGAGPNDRRVGIYGRLTEAVGSEAFDDVSTPRYEALKWLMVTDGKEICADDENLIQRFVLALLYYSTAGDTSWNKCSQNPTKAPCPAGQERFLSSADECSWDGITCVDGKVTNINLGRFFATSESLTSTISRLLFSLIFEPSPNV